MVTREDSHYGVSNSTQLSRLLTLGKPTVISTQKSMFAAPKHHQSFPNSYHIARSLTVGDVTIANSDQPLDFSVKKSSTNGSTKQEMLEEPTPHCFTPSPSPPDNTSANSSNIFLSPDNTLSNMLPLVDTGTLQATASLPVKTTLADTTITVSPTSPPLYAESAHNALLLSSMHHAAIPRTAFPANFPDNHANDPSNGRAVSGDSTTGLLTTVPLTVSPVAESGVSPKQSNKFVRPFKAYPRDPLKIPLNYYSYQAINSTYGTASAIDPEAVTTESILAKISEQKYKMFREMFKAERKATEHKRNSTLNKGVTSFKGDSLISSNSTGDQSNSSACSTNSGDSPTGMIGSTDDAKPKTSNMGSCNSVNGNAENILDAGRIPIAESQSEMNSSLPETKIGANESRKRPSSGRTYGDSQKDEAYWERRRKNNEAAKRSRDARRQKEDEITIRATFLEHENRLLRMELAALRTENERLKCQFYASGALALPSAQFSIGLDAAS